MTIENLKLFAFECSLRVGEIAISNKMAEWHCLQSQHQVEFNNGHNNGTSESDEGAFRLNNRSFRWPLVE